MKKNSLFIAALISFLTIALFHQAPLFNANKTTSTPLITGKGNPDNLLKTYQHWQNNFTHKQQGEIIHIPLQFAKAFSGARQQATGSVNINLLNGQLNATVTGLDPANNYNLAMVGFLKSKQTQAIEKNIGLFKIKDDHNLQLSVQLDRFSLHDFHLNRLIIKTTQTDLSTTALLTGSPSLFQRIFYSDKNWTVADVSHLQNANQAENNLPFSFLLPKPAFAHTRQVDLNTELTRLVADGRELFKNETFSGNGRTCVTCHRLDNNHTIDPKYIGNLAQNDPLFIAENNPQLAQLENPKLLRQLGLVLANVDGFDNPGVFRGVPHLFALGTSITPEQEFEGQQVVHALGWSADGSTGDGSLRMFTIGAVIQHLPKSLNRIEGVDFRLPTEYELDALEAYMLSLGRTDELDLDNMFFSSPVVQRGREIFHSKEAGTGQCKGCHFNAGGNSSSSKQNGNRDTGVENMPENPARLVWEPTPTDGGFGIEAGNDCGADQQQSCFGNREFNMTTVVEAADTPPFFHNNSVNTIEEAVAFYNSNAFHNSPGANPADPDDPESECERCIHLEPTQVVSIALFLRTLNAMENIRSSNQLDVQASQLRNQFRHQRDELIRLAMAETTDAIEVLEGGAIIPNPEAVQLLKKALKYQRTALSYQRFVFKSRWLSRYRQLLTKSILLKEQANALMLADS